MLFDRLSKGEQKLPGPDEGPEAAAAKPDLESLRTQQAELNRLLAAIQNMSASLDPRPAAGGGGKGEEQRPAPRALGMKAHDCGASFEAGARGWLDVFLRELLLNWFRQHEVLEAQLIRAFDEFDLVWLKPGGRREGKEGRGILWLERAECWALGARRNSRSDE